MKRKNLLIAIVSLLLTFLTAVSFAIEVKAAPANNDKAVVSATVNESKVTAKLPLIDINSATEAELKSVPGIGDGYAKKIIGARPYANKAQLKSRKILPVIIYEQVKERIIAKQPPKDVKRANKKN